MALYIRQWSFVKHFKLNNYVYCVHGKITEMLQPAQYCLYQKLAESKVPLKFKIKGTSFSDIFGSDPNWVSYSVFVETCENTLLGPMFSYTLCVHLFSCLHCSVQLPGARVAPGWPQYCQPITEELGGICSALIGPIDGWWRTKMMIKRYS